VIAFLRKQRVSVAPVWMPSRAGGLGSQQYPPPLLYHFFLGQVQTLFSPRAPETTALSRKVREGDNGIAIGMYVCTYACGCVVWERGGRIAELSGESASSAVRNTVCSFPRSAVLSAGHRRTCGMPRESSRLVKWRHVSALDSLLGWEGEKRSFCRVASAGSRLMNRSRPQAGRVDGACKQHLTLAATPARMAT